MYKYCDKKLEMEILLQLQELRMEKKDYIITVPVDTL